VIGLVISLSLWGAVLAFVEENRKRRAGCLGCYNARVNGAIVGIYSFRAWCCIWRASWCCLRSKYERAGGGKAVQPDNCPIFLSLAQ
jgi:hypothetical protein